VSYDPFGSEVPRYRYDQDGTPVGPYTMKPPSHMSSLDLLEHLTEDHPGAIAGSLRRKDMLRAHSADHAQGAGHAHETLD
jgi:hypothetical protein